MTRMLEGGQKMIYDPFEDIRVKLILPCNDNEILIRKIRNNMREMKEEQGIYLWITRMSKQEGSLYIDMRGERKIRFSDLIGKFLQKRRQRCFNVFAKMNRAEELEVFLKKKKASIKRFYKNCDIHMVGYNMKKGDDKVLVILLVEMTS